MKKTLTEIDSLEKETLNKSTGSQTNHYEGKFKEFLRENGLPNIETMLERFLRSYLHFSSFKSPAPAKVKA